MNDTNLLTVLFADISKSSQLYELLGNQAAQSIIGIALNQLSEITKAHNGTVIKTIGDEIMATFPAADAAVESAKAMQTSIQEIKLRDCPEFTGMTIRIGMHHGSVIIDHGDVFGDAVNLAARIAAYAKPGQILTTQATIEYLSKRYQTPVRHIDRITAKNISGEIDVYEIVWAKLDLTLMVDRKKLLTREKTWLELISGNKTILIDREKPRISIGRKDYNDIVIDCGWVSRTHAYIEYRRGAFFIQDKSSNGTFIYPDDSQHCLLKMDEHRLTGVGFIIFGRERSHESMKEAVYYTVKTDPDSNST
jgi:adenylate cyclase